MARQALAELVRELRSATRARSGEGCLPWIGEKPVAELTAPELLAALRRIEARGTLDTAHRTLQVCGRVLRYAVATGRAERDVSGDLRGAFPPVKRKHFAAITDPKEVGPLLRLLDGYPGTLPVRCALRLAPLLFVRPGELRKAEWADIDLDGAEWRYTATKTDTPHVVPLARQAVEILRELHPVTGHHRYVFPNARYRQRDRTMSNTTFWGAFRALDIPPERMTPHGFRAMARTILDEVLGFRPDFIEHQLAHRVRDPNGRAYNRTAFLPERRVMMQAWADYLDRLRAGEEIEATHGTGAFRNTNVAGDPRNTNSRPAVTGGWSRASHGRPCPQLPARVLRGSRHTGWTVGELDDPPPGSGVENPSRRDIWPGATPPGRVAGACTCQPSPMPYQGIPKGGRSRHGRTLRNGIAAPAAVCNRNAASDMRNRWRAHGSGVFVHMHPDV